MLEQCHHRPHDACVAQHGLLDVLLTEGEADLAEVARIGPHHLCLSHCQPGDQHQPIEAVDLDKAEQLPLERRAHFELSLRRERHAGRHDHTDIVHEHRTRRVEHELEGALVDGAHTEVVEQWQQIGERDRPPHAIHPEPHLTGRGEYRVAGSCTRRRDGGGQLSGTGGERQHLSEVAHGDVGRVQLVVTGRQGCHDALEHIVAHTEPSANRLDPCVAHRTALCRRTHLRPLTVRATPLSPALLRSVCHFRALSCSESGTPHRAASVGSWVGTAFHARPKRTRATAKYPVGWPALRCSA